MKKLGFSLIEMVVVVAVIGLVVPSIFAIIYGIVREQTKIEKLSTIKSEGDYILNVVANTVRNNALTIHSAAPPTDANEVCLDAASSDAGPIYFQNEFGEWFSFDLSSNTVSSSSSVLASPVALNSGQTIISNFSMGCSRGTAYSAPVVSMSFDICFMTGTNSCASSRTEETAQLHYQTKIKLRNF